MLKIKRLLSILSFLFLVPVHISAQKINQFNKNKKRTGIWKKYYPNNRIRYVGRFVDGKEVGTFKYYDIRAFTYPTIVKKFSTTSDSAFVSYYTLKGKLRVKGYMIGKKRVGKWIYYFPNGKLLSEEYYKDGKLEGNVKDYYKDGKTVVEHTQYSNGKENGFSRKYSDSGVMIEEVHYVNGLLEGRGRYFELNGDLKEEGMYKNGKRYGRWEFYIGGKKVTEKERRKENKFNKKDAKKKKKVKDENN